MDRRIKLEVNVVVNQLKLSAGLRGKNMESRTIQLYEPHDSELVIYAARIMARQVRFKQTEEFLIAAAASELSNNILRYAKYGTITISIVVEECNQAMGIELYADDMGPGIESIEVAMQDNYSTLQNSLGMGLPSVNRIMDEFLIESVVGQGTRVLAYKWNHRGEHV